jgi:hypothetical protein
MPDDLVAEAVRRLQQAGLIPPIGGVEAVGPIGAETIVVSVRGPIPEDLPSEIAAAMGSLPYRLQQVSPTHGVSYRHRP